VLTLSKQKAQEAKLIKAQQEGFQAAIDMVGSEIAASNAATDRQRKEPVKRRARRPIRDMILHELSFSGQAMTTAQIARAIDSEMPVDGSALDMPPAPAPGA
jgi:hypothetical protein